MTATERLVLLSEPENWRWISSAYFNLPLRYCSIYSDQGHESTNSIPSPENYDMHEHSFVPIALIDMRRSQHIRQQLLIASYVLITDLT